MQDFKIIQSEISVSGMSPVQSVST